MKVLKCISSLFFLFFLTFVSSQTITIIDQDTKQVIPGVTVYNFKKDKSVISDINGKASVDSFDINEILYFHNLLYEDIQIKKAAIVKNKSVVFLSPYVEGLSQIVISASKFEQSKRDIPRSIISINAKEIAIANPQTSADLLGNTGNVFVQKSQLGGGSPIIRGFSTNRLLITVDGVRMNNAIFRGGNVQNVISVDPFNIQSTEVTLGAGSVIYGSDAIGGVMSFYNKKPEFSYKDKPIFNAHVVTRYASANNEKTGHIDASFGLKKWAFLTSTSFADFDDLRMGSHGHNEYLRTRRVGRQNNQDIIVPTNNPKIQDPTGYHQFNMMQKIRHKASDNLSLDLGLHFSTTSNFPRYDRLIRPRGEDLASAEWEYGPQQWLMANFQLTKLSSSSNLYDKIQTTFAYQNYKEERISRNFQSNFRRVSEENVHILSFNLDLEKKLSTKTSFSYGVEYLYNYIRSKGREDNISDGTSLASVTRYPNGSDWQSLATYASLKYKPSAKFVFQTGLRYNHIISTSNFDENNVFLNLPFSEAEINTGALTGTAGITWSPSSLIQWKFNLSTAFRAPNIDDVGKVFDSEPGSVVVPNNDLESEYAYSGELGLRLNFDRKVIFDIATYYTFLNDALTRKDFQINGDSEIIYDDELSNVQAIQNASEAFIYGFEAGLEVNFTDDFKLRSHYNVIGGKEESNGVDTPVRHVAPNFGRTHLIWQKNKLLLDAFMVYNGELSFNELAPSEVSKDYLYATDANGNPFSPSWYTLNLRTQYQFTNALNLTASLENITDQRYRPYSSGIAASGRNLILALGYNF